METEQLKMIIDALQGATDAGATAFVWWLVADKVLPAVVTLICVLGVANLIVSVVRQSVASIGLVKRLGERLGAECGYMGDPVPDNIEKRVNEVLDKVLDKGK